MSRSKLSVSTETCDLTWSTSMGGWLQFWLFGVAKSIQQFGLDKNGATRTRMAGCSSGALTAAGLILEGDFDEAVEHCKKHALVECRQSLLGLFRLTKYAGDCLDATVKLENYKNCNGFLEIQVTKLPFFDGERISEFHSAKDLRTCLLASCAAFPLASLINFRGGLYVDGGLSDFQPTFNKNTITISPFYFSRADIRPSRYVPAWWSILPPTDNETIDWMYHLGYEDGKAWILKNALRLGISSPRNSFNDVSVACAVEAMPPIIRSQHPYDMPGRVTLNRLAGYDIFPPTGAPILYWLIDMTILVWLNLLWKPVSIVLIYLELMCIMVNCFVYGLIVDIMIGLPLRLLSLGRFHSSFVSWRNMWDCLVCAASLCLPIKIIPVIGGLVSIQEATHARLFRQSLVYRVVWRML